MSSNLFKAYHTVKETSVPRVIDGNVAVEEVIERLKFTGTDDDTGTADDDIIENDAFEGEAQGFFDGLDAESIDALLGDGGDPEATNIIKAKVTADAEAMKEKAIHDVEEMRKQMMEEAQADVAMMKNEAAVELDRERAMTLEIAKNEGYQLGMEQAKLEMDRMKNDLQKQRKQWEEEYEDKLYDLEPQFVRHITNIYEKIFQIELSDKKEIVMNVLHNAMQKIEGTKNYIIHVSRDDYSLVNEHKNELVDAAMAADVIIDVVEDMTMKHGDCMIETANGIFDCGIDTQLTAIKRRLTLLSYDGRD
ncbi:MAG: hypothetical protein K6G69_05025 [Lachnospiraceae bacterium]|nr:hypothetical protein [Lachnospiraceae bacterium]